MSYRHNKCTDALSCRGWHSSRRNLLRITLSCELTIIFKKLSM